MATAATLPSASDASAQPQSSEAPKKQTLLQAIGKDIKGVFAWLGSSKGQAVIATGESLVETVVPQATGIINIANSWMSEIIKDEALAAAAGSQDGTGTQKASAVLTSVTPQVLAFFQQHNLPAPTAEQIENANNALVQFLNAFTPAQAS